MATMALDPVPFDPVRLGGVEQFLPQLRILDRLTVRGSPAILQPAVDPTGDSVPHIDGIGVELDPAGAGQRLQAAYRPEPFHSVVGGPTLPARQLLLAPARANDHPP